MDEWARYENGYGVDPMRSGIYSGIPPWASSLGFCGKGCYVVISTRELLTVSDEVQPLGEMPESVYLELFPPPMTADHCRVWFKKIEASKVALMAANPTVTVTCKGGMFYEDSLHEQVIRGSFVVRSEIGVSKLVVESELNCCMFLSGSANSFRVKTSGQIVSTFTVRGTLTMDLDRFKSDLADTFVAENPLFGPSSRLSSTTRLLPRLFLKKF